MVQQILLLIVEQLNSYIMSLSPVTTAPVVAGNIGMATSTGGNQAYMDERVVVSIVNLMEEITLKNTTPYRPATLNPEIENPPVFLNAYFLITANFHPAGAMDDQSYHNGIARLSQVIEFFQGKRYLTVQNSPLDEFLPETLAGADAPPPALQEVCINMELVSLTFEQTNYLWGTLGGKQLPFVLYKAHVLPVKRELTISRGGIVQDVESGSVHVQGGN